MKNLQVKLTFLTDTKAAQQQIQGLQQSLSNIAMMSPTKNMGQKMANDISKASKSAIDLKVALNQATNVDTGKLNFTKFQQSLKNTGKTVQDFARELAAIGPDGQQAVMQLARSLQNAETPLVSLSGKLQKLKQTFSNTIGWSISSSVIQGITGAISGTIDYAKELNESLNNIRIVTGKSSEDMARFAKSANKAAKALSATTTEYTNASLIYYQQGLDGKAVEERANVTLKLANVTKQSAEEVSEWMTAIWNNFDDGSQSLEYYADVMAKLGAATASSADEIAAGLEKFAAVADTVGLSYEYATSALATITAETRQSADVVGTALKTIFARMENLELGETLDDGTTLGKYSAALEKVGVTVKDANGNLKDMDDILSEMGNTWNLLNRDEQVALAQQVAGIRQYSQFMALMDNWDTMEENLEISKQATGELEYQQKIYEEGIAGATARVQAALEEMKNTILDEDDLLPFLNGFEKVLGFVNKLIDALGGAPGLLVTISSILSKMYTKEIAGATRGLMSGITSSYKIVTGKAQKEQTQVTKEVTNIAGDAAANEGSGQAGMLTSEYLKEQADITETINQKQKTLNEFEKEQLNLLQQIAEKKYEIAKIAALEEEGKYKEAEALREKVKKAEQQQKEEQEKKIEDKQSIENKDKDNKEKEENKPSENASEQKPEEKKKNKKPSGWTDPELNEIEDAIYIDVANENKIESFDEYASGKHKRGSKTFRDRVSGLTEDIEDKSIQEQGSQLIKHSEQYQILTESTKKSDNKLNQLKEVKEKKASEGKSTKKEDKKIEKEAKRNQILRKEKEKLKKTIDNETKTLSKNSKEYSKTDKVLKKYEKQGKDINKDVKDWTKTKKEQIKVEQDVTKKTKDLNKTMKDYKKDAENAGKADPFDKIANGVSTITSAVSGVMMLHGAFDSLTTSLAEGDYSLGSFLSSLMSMAFGLGQIIPLLGAMKVGTEGLTLAEILSKKATEAKNKEGTKSLFVAGIRTLASKLTIKAEEAEAKATEKGAKKSMKAGILKAIGGIIGWLGKGPAGWIIAGISAAAIAALGIGLSVNAKKSANAEEAEKEQANENFNEANEKAKANKEKYDNYEQLYAAYEKTGENREEMVKAAEEIAKAYEIEGAAALTLAGNYEELNKRIKAARVEELEGLSGAAEATLALNAKDWKEKAGIDDSGEFTETSDNKFTGTFTSGGNDDSKEVIMQKVLQDYIAKNPDAAAILSKDDKNNWTLNTPNDPQGWYRAYNHLKNILGLASKQGVTTENNIYSRINEYLADHKSSIEANEAALKAQIETDAELKVLKTTSGSGKSYDEITNFGDFQSYRKKLLEGTFEGSDEYNAIIAQLNNNEYTKGFNARSEAMESILESAGGKEKVSSTIVDGLNDIFTNGSDLLIKAAANTEYTKGMTWDQYFEKVKDNMLKGAEALRDEAASNYKMSSQAADAYARVLAKTNSELGKNKILLNQVAASSIALNNEIKNLTEVWEDNSEALNSSDGIEYAIALDNISKAMQQMFSTDTDLTGWVSQNQQLLSQFINGDISKLPQIQKSIAETIVDNSGASIEGFDTLLNTLNAKNYAAGAVIDTVSADIQTVCAEGGAKLTILTEALKAAGWEIEIIDGQFSKLTRLTDESTIDTSWIKERQKEIKESKKDFDEEIERYYQLNKAIEQQERALDKIRAAKDRAFGADKLTLMQAEAKEIENQIKLEKDLQKAMEADLITDRDKLNKYGFSTDENGQISNYEQAYQNAINYYNKLVEGGNKDQASDWWEEFENALSQYEDTLQGVQEQQQKTNDLIYEAKDLALEEIEFKVSIQIDVAEDEKAYLEFLMQEIENDAFAAADAIGNMTQQLKPLETQIKATEEGIASIMADIEANGGVMDEAQAEKLREYRDNLIEYNAELLELRTTVQDKLTEAYDAWNEKLDENASVIEHYGSVIEHYKNIIDIVGKDDLGISDETLNQMRRAQVSNANDAVKASKAALDANQAYLDDLRQKRAAAAAEYGADSIEVKEWDEQIKTAEEKVREATATFNDNWANALQVAADVFQDSVTQIVETFSESVSGIYKNLEELQEAFDRQVEVNDRYLAQYEKTYEISKLNRQISDSIDKTDNVGSQKELRDLQKQLLAMNEEGVEVSQRDIEFMQKKYDLMLAEQALKDAQNAKSVVRLQRDSEGNFGYVYTADQGNVDKAQQNYEEKLYQMQKFGDESLMEVQEQIIATNQEFADALQAIAENANLSMEEKKAKQEEITAYYTEKLKYWTDEANKFMLHGQEMNQQYNANMADSFEDTLLHKMLPDLQDFESYYEQSMVSMNAAGEDFVKAVEAQQARYETAMSLAGTSIDDFENTAKIKLEKVQKESDDTAESVGAMVKSMNDALNGKSVSSAISAVNNFQANYSSKFGIIRQENLNTIESIDDLISKYRDMETAASNAAEAQGKGGTSSGAQDGVSNTENTIPPYKDPDQQNKKQGKQIKEVYNFGNNSFITTTDGVNYKISNSLKDTVTFNNGRMLDTSSNYLNRVSKYFLHDWSWIKHGEFGSHTLNKEGSQGWWATTNNRLDTHFSDAQVGDSITGSYMGENRNKVKYYSIYIGNTHAFVTAEALRKMLGLNDISSIPNSFDTGGYTGNWGPEGRLAMLHQKELVLNAHDTENFLTAIGIVRDISDQIEKNAMVMQYQNQLANYRTSINNNNDTLQQEVHITAEFPNATNHSEIEEAFRNLTNLASQYANRKN